MFDFLKWKKAEFVIPKISSQLSKAVYSDHEIFLRELVSNGVDAISKRRMASMAGDCENTEEAQVKYLLIVRKIL